MLTAIAAILAVLTAAIAIMIVRLRRAAQAVTAARAAAEELLWRRYNLTSDLISWADNEGGPAADSAVRAMVAARADIMKARGQPAERLAAEDKLQAALNAFYRAADADEALMSIHEVVLIVSHLMRADARAHAAVADYNRLAEAFNARIAAGPGRAVARLARVAAGAPMHLKVAPDIRADTRDSATAVA
ncbi:MAG: LemA family protein [Rhodospirillaceae bacterium]|nr:LemA family protein [Rhodospirillaceae bacterium]